MSQVTNTIKKAGTEIPVRIHGLIAVMCLCSLTICCSRFDNEVYCKQEDKAIADLIPSMVDDSAMVAMNDFGTPRPILYVIEDLDTLLILNELRRSSVSNEDQEALEPLTNSKMSTRKIPHALLSSYKNFTVVLLSIEDFRKNHDSMVEKINKGGILGYLMISRVILDADYKKGYVSFSFFCGEACAWDSTIEITNEKGVWKENRFIFGGIS